MSVNPKLIVMNKPEFMNEIKGMTSWYMKFGAIPRAMYSPDQDAIIVLKGYENNMKLMCHEYGHAINYPNSDHPDNFLNFVKYCFVVGFDVRVPVGVLRIRMGPKDLVLAYRKWRNSL